MLAFAQVRVSLTCIPYIGKAAKEKGKVIGASPGFECIPAIISPVHQP